jgi:hypothetical protein
MVHCVVVYTEYPRPTNTGILHLRSRKSPTYKYWYIINITYHAFIKLRPTDPRFISTRQATHSEHVCPLCLTSVE